jgi:hypothetical protein
MGGQLMGKSIYSYKYKKKLTGELAPLASNRARWSRKCSAGFRTPGMVLGLSKAWFPYLATGFDCASQDCMRHLCQPDS